MHLVPGVQQVSTGFGTEAGASNPPSCTSSVRNEADLPRQNYVSASAANTNLGDGLIEATEKKISFHRPLTFYVDITVRLKPKAIFQVSIGGRRDLDTVRQTV